MVERKGDDFFGGEEFEELRKRRQQHFHVFQLSQAVKHVIALIVVFGY